MELFKPSSSLWMLPLSKLLLIVIGCKSFFICKVKTFLDAFSEYWGCIQEIFIFKTNNQHPESLEKQLEMGN